MIAIELFRRLADSFGLLKRRADTRKQLLQLSDWELKDLGISRGDALIEGTKPFWKK